METKEQVKQRILDSIYNDIIVLDEPIKIDKIFFNKITSKLFRDTIHFSKKYINNGYEIDRYYLGYNMKSKQYYLIPMYRNKSGSFYIKEGKRTPLSNHKAYTIINSIFKDRFGSSWEIIDKKNQKEQELEKRKRRKEKEMKKIITLG
jgi:hypothetical protein